jgi:hypothetical protein
MGEVTFKRVCNTGLKNCKMPELRAQISELETEAKEHFESGRLVGYSEGQKTASTALIAKLEAVKGVLDAVGGGPMWVSRRSIEAAIGEDK